MIGGSMGGLFLKLIFFSKLISKLSGKTMGLMGYRPKRKDLEELNQLVEQGKLKPVIDKVFSLHQTTDAFRYFGKGEFKGKVVISIA